jgi:hypothetical protein
MARGRTTKSAGKGASKSKPRPAGKRAKKVGAPAKGAGVFEDEEPPAEDAEEELPKDEAGRHKIKRQYEELLGIRIEKLRGRILNRERINKTIEGIYFICASCRKICHNLDEGLVEDPNNVNNLCHACANVKEPRGGGKGGRVAAA